MAEVFSGPAGFEWDEHNSRKNWEKHKVETRECEEVFFNAPIVFKEDLKHSQQEQRYYCLGRTGSGRQLFVVFALRGILIRVISARDMNRKEREVYLLL